MSSSASDSVAGYVTVNPTFPIRFLVSTAFVSTLYIFAMIRSQKHVYDVTF
jgi:F0F1-type ATP synthase membrane subunit c/vacuolar-type H+-ATPase subunit K